MANNCQAQLNRWFQTALGRRLLKEEADALQQILPHLFGYHLLQIGTIGHGYLLESSRISHRCVLNPSYSATVCALPDALPFAQDSIDVVVLPHILEFEENPLDILREVERVLIPEGNVVILGFNPLSLWGGWRYLSRGKTAPWCGRFLPISRIKNCLASLGFDFKKQQSFFFSLPFNETGVLEKIGARWMGYFGAVYLLHAKKRVTTITPIKPRWLSQPALVTEAVGTQRKSNEYNNC